VIACEISSSIIFKRSIEAEYFVSKMSLRSIAADDEKNASRRQFALSFFVRVMMPSSLRRKNVIGRKGVLLFLAHFASFQVSWASPILAYVEDDTD
jgi:hypothetical protein